MSKKGYVVYLSIALLSLSLAVSACDKGGGEGEGSAEPAATGGGGASAGGGQPAQDLSDPRQLGAAIGQHYVEVMLRVRELVADQPDPATLRPQLEALKAQYIPIFVELGHRVEGLERLQRSQVDSGVMAAYSQLPDFQWFNDATTYYRGLDNDLANLIASFNVITQYAFFDLLRRQEPEEAQRLGVAN